MAKLKDKIKLALDEARMLVLGSQILLGFEYRAALEKAFDQLPTHVRYFRLAALCGTILANALFMWPATFHQITEQGEDTPRLMTFARRVIGWGLLPFALAFGFDVYSALQKYEGELFAAFAGGSTILIALFFWYGIEFWQKRKSKKPEKTMPPEAPMPEKTKLVNKIEQLMTEGRIIIPGAQALLGFQLIAFLMEGFDRLPASSKTVQVISLGLIGLSTILLMTPAAYHRIAEDGEDTERFYRFANRIILCSMVPLAAGVAGDFYIVTQKVTQSAPIAAGLAILVLILCLAAWFGYSLFEKRQIRAHDKISPR